MIVYLNNKFLPITKARISPFDRGFLFADGVYEAIRTYNGKLFKMEEHINRLKRSLKELGIKYNPKEIEKIIYELIKRNKLTNADVLAYVQITRGAYEKRIHYFPSEKINPTVFIFVTNLLSNKKDQDRGIKVILNEDTRWTRCDIKSISLLPNVLLSQQAKKASATESVLIKNGEITEGTHTGFFAIKSGELITTPLSNEILGSITREIIIELCNKLIIPVREEPIKVSALRSYDEFFISSTTKEIMPVIQIDNLKVKSGKPGQITRMLKEEFIKLTKSY